MSPYENLHPAHVRARDLGGAGELSGYALTCIAERLGVPLYRDPADAEQPHVGEARKSQPARPIACGRRSFNDALRGILVLFSHCSDEYLSEVARGSRESVYMDRDLAAALLCGRKLMQEFGQ